MAMDGARIPRRVLLLQALGRVELWHHPVGAVQRRQEALRGNKRMPDESIPPLPSCRLRVHIIRWFGRCNKVK
jgi:hypothetical protein